MAGNIIIGSKFRPFSYEEMLAPVAMATQAHQDVETQYADLSTKANVWEEMADQEKDQMAYQMYKTYSDDLRKQAETLAKQGLNPNSRQSMLDMKGRYSKEILPIEQAYARRKELIDEQRKMAAQDNTIMFDKNAS